MRQRTLQERPLPDSRQAVGDHNCRATAHLEQLVQSLLNHPLRLHIQRRSCLVQQEDSRVL